MKKHAIMVVLVIVIVVLVIGAAGGAMKLFQEPEPAEMVSAAIQKLNAAQSFRFTLVQHEYTGAQERLQADIKGDKNGSNVSIKGKLAGNDVFMMCFGEDFFNMDLVNQKWVQYPGIANTVIQQLFPVEFNPSTLVEFDGTGEVVPLEEDSQKDTKCWIYDFTPRITNESFGREWTNFAATVYIDRSTKDVICIVLTADHSKTGRKLHMNFGFSDIGSQIDIQKP
jgi:hypothetical protein